jgi:hypothetical protein
MEETHMSMKQTTHDQQMEGYLQPYTPDTTPADHWSLSPSWQEYRRAQAAAEGREYVPPVPAAPIVVEDVCAASQRARAAWAEQEARFEEARNPKPTAIDPALVQAEQNLRAAVQVMMQWARIEAIIAIVKQCQPAPAVGGDLIWRPGSR